MHLINWSLTSLNSLLIHSIQNDTIFKGVDAPANSGQAVQSSEKLQKTQELLLRLYRPQLGF